MGERFRTFRKLKGLKQYELAHILKVDCSLISKIENDVTVVSEQIIKLLTFIYQLNENWLRYGTGSMFLSEPVPTNDPNNTVILRSDREKEIFNKIRKASPEVQKIILDAFDFFVNQEQLLNTKTSKNTESDLTVEQDNDEAKKSIG
ncbi:hypothetical protein PilKf_01843 [Pillotina sp. SPG140]